MNELIEYIDEQICACVGNVKSYGLCHLLIGDNESFPGTVAKQSVKAIPDDRNDVTIYHRLLNGSYNDREDLSFGRRVTAQNGQKIRTVVFVKYECDHFIDDIVNALPDNFEVTNYQFANVSKDITLIRDRESIWNEEFTGAYKDRYQMKFLIYALEYDLQYIKCNVCL